MRDPNRIPVVLDKLKEVWGEVPDWRFMQLMCNRQRMYGSDMFYVEDDRFVDFLEKLFEED